MIMGPSWRRPRRKAADRMYHGRLALGTGEAAPSILNGIDAEVLCNGARAVFDPAPPRDQMVSSVFAVERSGSQQDQREEASETVTETHRL
jgi:hypothetical protein